MSAAADRPAAMLPGDTVYRIHWVPGTDRLLGVCYCGTEQEFEDPVELWDWLLAHPATMHALQDSHGGPAPGRPR